MTKYDVYESNGNPVAAQAGWSWGGFLFGWVWAVVNGLWLHAVGHFVFMYVYWQIYSSIYNQGSVALLSIIGFSVPVVYGIFGNKWIGKKISDGGPLVGTFDASSKEGAAMLYLQQKQIKLASQR